MLERKLSMPFPWWGGATFTTLVSATVLLLLHGVEQAIYATSLIGLACYGLAYIWRNSC